MKRKKIRTTRDYWETNIELKERQIWLQVTAIILILVSIAIALTDYNICPSCG